VVASIKFEKIDKSSTSAPLSPLAGPGTGRCSCCVTRTLNTTPTAPEIIATKTKYAKSQRIAVTKSKNKHDVNTVVDSKSRRIAT
jgi:hypothetical protein